MLLLSEWAQRIVTFRSGASELVANVGIFYKIHIIMGLIVFMVFPFSRLVHIWSAPIWYIGRPGYQIVRTRRPTSGIRKPAP
jgi:nitrate reductase gamma subunit